MQIYLCEDIAAQAESLQLLLEECAKELDVMINVESFSEGESLFKTLQKKKETGEKLPNLLFCDIKMPGLDGISLGRLLCEEMPEIRLVFLTAYGEYAIEGYETGAYRYLMKPAEKEKVLQILEKTLKEGAQEQLVLWNGEDEETCVKIKDIVYISAEDKYLVIHTIREDFLERESLHNYEALLRSQGFFRIHRKYLINMRHHKSIGNGKITLSGDVTLPVSRRKINEYRQCFLQSLEGGLLK